MHFRIMAIGLLLALSATVTCGWQKPVVKDRKFFEERGEIVWEVPTDHKVLALTFDDGPDRTDTAMILDLLQEYDARATFFVVGNCAERFPDLLRREAAEGHEIANHTYSHPYFNKKIPISEMEDQIRKTDRIIYAATGQWPALFRSPGGYYDERVVEASKKTNHTFVMWSWHQDTGDWNTPGVHKIVRKVLKNAKNGDIVLFHDHVHGKTQTIEALKRILPELQARGFQFITVSELLTMSKSHFKDRLESIAPY